MPIACTTQKGQRGHQPRTVSIIFNVVVIVACVPNGHKFNGRQTNEQSPSPNKRKPLNAHNSRNRNSNSQKINPNIYVIGCVVNDPNMPRTHHHWKHGCEWETDCYWRGASHITSYNEVHAMASLLWQNMCSYFVHTQEYKWRTTRQRRRSLCNGLNRR